MGATQTIYVELLHEGTTCWRPVLAERVGESQYRIVGERDDDESWAFKPGDVVNCKVHVFASGGSGLVAFEKL